MNYPKCGRAECPNLVLPKKYQPTRKYCSVACSHQANRDSTKASQERRNRFTLTSDRGKRSA